MSEARGTYVSIYLKDEATKHLQKIDKLVGEVERNFINLGQEVDESTANVDSLTKAVQKTNRELKDSADSADSLTNSLIKSEQNAQGVQKASSKIETELEGSKKEAQSLTGQLTTAKTSMGALSQEANQVEISLQGAGSAASNLSGIIAGIGAGAVITGLVASVSEFESAMGRIEAKTALTGEELASVQDAVNSVYTSGIGQDFTTVTDDVTRIKTSLRGLDGEELVSFSKNAMTMADLWGESTDDVTWAVKNMTSNFDGLSETEALDLLTVGFQRTGNYSQDLLDTFKEYSPYFSKMGLDAEEFTSILVSGAESGAWNLDKVGDAVKEFGIRGMDGSKSTATGFALIGLEADNMANQIAKGGDSANQAFYATIAALAAMDDEVKRNEAGVALFGTQWEDVREDVILAMGDAKDAVLDFEGAAEKATESATDNFGTDLLSTVREFKSEVGEMFSTGTGAEAMAKGLDTVKVALDGAKTGLEWILDNGETLTAIIAGAGASFATFKVISTINALLTAYQASAFASTVATQGFNAALRANPIGMVVTAIGLLVAGGVLLYQNWDIVSAKTKEVWNSIGGLGGALRLVTGPIGIVIGAAIDLAKNWDNTKSVWENVWGAMQRSAAATVNSVIGGINSMIATINKIPGVNIPVIAKVDWGDAKGSSGGAAAISNAKPDGSHATGLAHVGWDGYQAELHHGESVLTAVQSDTLRGMGVLSSNGDGTPNLNLSPLVQPVATSAPTKTNGPTISISAPISLTVQGNADDITIQKLRGMLDNDVRRILSELINQQLAGMEG